MSEYHKLLNRLNIKHSHISCDYHTFLPVTLITPIISTLQPTYLLENCHIPSWPCSSLSDRKLDLRKKVSYPGFPVSYSGLRVTYINLMLLNLCVCMCFMIRVKERNYNIRDYIHTYPTSNYIVLSGHSYRDSLFYNLTTARETVRMCSFIVAEVLGNMYTLSTFH